MLVLGLLGLVLVAGCGRKGALEPPPPAEAPPPAASPEATPLTPAQSGAAP